MHTCARSKKLHFFQAFRIAGFAEIQADQYRLGTAAGTVKHGNERASTVGALVKLEIDGTRGNDGRNRMFVDHLRDRIFEQHDVLIERIDLPLQLDAVDQVDRYRDVFFTQSVQERVL